MLCAIDGCRERVARLAALLAQAVAYALCCKDIHAMHGACFTIVGDVQLKDEQAAPPAAAASISADAAAPQQVTDLQEALCSEQARHKEAKQALLKEQQYFASEITHLEALIRGKHPIFCVSYLPTPACGIVGSLWQC